MRSAHNRFLIFALRISPSIVFLEFQVHYVHPQSSDLRTKYQFLKIISGALCTLSLILVTYAITINFMSLQQPSNLDVMEQLPYATEENFSHPNHNNMRLCSRLSAWCCGCSVGHSPRYARSLTPSWAALAPGFQTPARLILSLMCIPCLRQVMHITDNMPFCPVDRRAYYLWFGDRGVILCCISHNILFFFLLLLNFRD